MNQTIDEIKITDLCTVSADENIKSACIKMREKKCGSAIVMDSENNLQGIFTERDTLYKVVAEGIDAESTPVSSIMVSNVRTISGSETIFNALNVLKENNIRRLVVSDNGKVTGIITIKDLMYSMINTLQEENSFLGELLIEEINNDIDDLKDIRV